MKTYTSQEVKQPQPCCSSSSDTTFFSSSTVGAASNKLFLSSDLLNLLNILFFSFLLLTLKLSREGSMASKLLLHSQSSIPFTAGSSGSKPLSKFLSMSSAAVANSGLTLKLSSTGAPSLLSSTMAAMLSRLESSSGSLMSSTSWSTSDLLLMSSSVMVMSPALVLVNSASSSPSTSSLSSKAASPVSMGTSSSSCPGLRELAMAKEASGNVDSTVIVFSPLSSAMFFVNSCSVLETVSLEVVVVVVTEVLLLIFFSRLCFWILTSSAVTYLSSVAAIFTSSTSSSSSPS